MSWGLVAVAGATAYSAVSASNAAGDATDAASAANAAQLAFDQKRYDDWQNTYGSIQDNLANYYEGLTPDAYAAEGLEEFQKQYQTGLQRIDENLAQRGIDPSSGLAASIESQAELNAAETKASIRRDAPKQVRKEQTDFLQIGLGQNPANNLSSTYAQQSQQAGRDANAANIAAGSAWEAAIPAIGKAIDSYNTGEA